MPRARGGNQPIENFENDLGMPAGFGARAADPGQAPGAALDFLQNHRPPGQNYWPALVLALVAQSEKVLTDLGVARASSRLAVTPPVHDRQDGRLRRRGYASVDV